MRVHAELQSCFRLSDACLRGGGAPAVLVCGRLQLRAPLRAGGGRIQAREARRGGRQGRGERASMTCSSSPSVMRQATSMMVSLSGSSPVGCIAW